MSRTLMSALLLGGAALAACTTPAPPPEAAWVGQARSVAATVPPKLLAVLTDEIAKGGPEGAIEACNVQAPALARAASAQSGWTIRRVSLRERNPKAVPDAWERAVLQDFDRRAAAGESLAQLERAELVPGADGRPEQRYMKALGVVQICTACHGPAEALTPAVKAQLQQRYPADRATGYHLGEVRGALTLRRPAG